MSERLRPPVRTVLSSEVRLCVARRRAATPRMSENSSPSSPRDSLSSGLLPLSFEATVGDLVPVDEDLESVDLDDLVVLVDLPVEGKAVAEAGTAAARDVHPEIRVLDRAQWLAGLGIGPLDELLDFVRCGFRRGHLNHCATPHPRNTMTPLFNHLVASCATPSRSGGSLEELPHVPTLRAESEALSSQTVCSVARHMTSSSARRARLMWTSKVRPLFARPFLGE